MSLQVAPGDKCAKDFDYVLWVPLPITLKT